MPTSLWILIITLYSSNECFFVWCAKLPVNDLTSSNLELHSLTLITLLLSTLMPCFLHILTGKVLNLIENVDKISQAFRKCIGLDMEVTIACKQNPFTQEFLIFR